MTGCREFSHPVALTSGCSQSTEPQIKNSLSQVLGELVAWAAPKESNPTGSRLSDLIGICGPTPKPTVRLMMMLMIMMFIAKLANLVIAGS